MTVLSRAPTHDRTVSVLLMRSISSHALYRSGVHAAGAFAPKKTQVMVISRSLAVKLAAEGKLCFDGVPLLLQETVNILGVEVDRELRFDGHIKHISQKASHWVIVLRRVIGFLDKEGKL